MSYIFVNAGEMQQAETCCVSSELTLCQLCHYITVAQLAQRYAVSDNQIAATLTRLGPLNASPTAYAVDAPVMRST